MSTTDTINLPQTFTRRAEIHRETAETSIQIKLDLDGAPANEQWMIRTSVPFLDHMLGSWAKHSRFGLDICAKGDTEIDDHHTVEDIGITLGKAFAQAIGDKRGIARFGSAYAPLDEALARTVIDISGRSCLVYSVPEIVPWVGRFDTALIEEFWIAFTNNAMITLHLDVIRGRNAHHILEALFKSSAIAFRNACKIEVVNGEIPSTKGVL